MTSPLRPLPTALRAPPVAETEHPAPARDETPTAQRPQIDYTRTRRLPGALERLQRTPGVVRPDRSELSETFKRLRSLLLQRLATDGHTLLAVTSPRATPGKSLTALNLALAVAAELDRTALLVDADLNGGGMQTLLGLDEAPGLAEHLSDGRPLDTLLLNPGVARLVVLPAGRCGQLGSAELLATKAMQQLGQEIKQRYPDRVVVIDLPPLLDTADALALLPLADTTLLVAEEHGTPLADLEAASELLAPYNLVGSVLARRAAPQAGARRWWQRLRRR